jgi:hypothetical protein
MLNWQTYSTYKKMDILGRHAEQKDIPENRHTGQT